MKIELESNFDYTPSGAESYITEHGITGCSIAITKFHADSFKKILLSRIHELCPKDNAELSALAEVARCAVRNRAQTIDRSCIWSTPEPKLDNKVLACNAVIEVLYGDWCTYSVRPSAGGRTQTAINLLLKEYERASSVLAGVNSTSRVAETPILDQVSSQKTPERNKPTVSKNFYLV